MMVACGADVIALSRSAPEIPGALESLDLEDGSHREDHFGHLGCWADSHSRKQCRGAPGGPLLTMMSQILRLRSSDIFTQPTKLRGWLYPPWKKRTGRIVNIISTSVREPIPNIGLSNTLRGAMASWAKSLSRELLMHYHQQHLARLYRHRSDWGHWRHPLKKNGSKSRRHPQYMDVASSHWPTYDAAKLLLRLPSFATTIRWDSRCQFGGRWRSNAFNLR